MSEWLDSSGETTGNPQMDRLINKFFPDDWEYIFETFNNDQEDILMYFYGLLEDIGEDADKILVEYGILEP